ncbi:MAG: glutathione S-transferase family protein [Thermoleophilaceae bacterium]|nr:glutathione S-transferase family protein [Thermoleophilaceae bacterium]
MTLVLWHIELSHYNEKARWALDYKGLRYERRVPMPGLHGVRALIETRGAQRRLPVLEIDGRAVGDSTAIIAALEEYAPDPPLYPAHPADRARALQLEDYFDEQLGPEVRRFVWHHTLADTDAVSRALFTAPNRGRERMLRATAPVAGFFVRRDYGADDDGARRAREAVVASMDRLESELQPSGYLVGDSFTVADLTAAALFTPALHPPGRPFMPSAVVPAVQELREELAARPGGEWVTRMYAEHRGAYAGVPDVVHH